MVAVDEMFSKTDDEFSQYLLDLFKEFHLQLLIVQPLDAKIMWYKNMLNDIMLPRDRDGLSFVGDLSVQEHEQFERGGSEVEAEKEDSTIETDK